MILVKSPRQVVVTAGLSVTALLLAACGGGEAEKSLDAADVTNGSPKAGEVKAGALDGVRVTFVGAGGEIQDRQVAALQGWAEESGATIVQDSPTDYAKIKSQVLSGRGSWDVVDVEWSWSPAHCGDLLLELDDDIVDRSVLPASQQGTPCSVPIVTTGTVLAYNSKKYPTAPTSWADFFDAERFPGRRALYAGNPVGVLEAALLADGVAAQDLYPLDVERALAKLDTIKDDLQYWATGAKSQQMIESGQVDMGIFWSGRVLSAADNGTEWDVVTDQPLMIYDDLVVPKSAPNPVAAMSLINYALGTQAQDSLAEGTGYPGTNTQSRPRLPDTVGKYFVTRPPFTNQIPVDGEWWGEHIDEVTDRWTTWIND